MQIIDFPKPKMHLFVCINQRDKDNPKPSCAPRITADMVNQLKIWIREQGLTTTVYCTKAQCLGFCNAEGSVAVIYPEGTFVNGIQNLDDLKKLIKERV
ncbi:hypothetical protein COV20_01865 [Candidatus Woesearchaeota archaeon CG10_big_fil_rev_8_21_14_0_10_45_16]|nr:MAG: hypothetical protein COV20_01865 [Candidatus Woesearchaeota archaeon CG10_big_fil_rev_8_21_14_0_10_45_16]